MQSSELESALAGAVCQRCDAAVVLVAAAVEDHRRDALLLRALRDEGADLAREGALVAILVGAQLERRGTHQRVAGEVVDDLRGDVPGGPGHDEARARRRARDLLADAEVAAGLAQPAGC